MSVTFREIGGRAKIQGGESYVNLAVNNRIATVQPLIIDANPVLLDSLLTALGKDASLVATVANPVTAQILSESVNVTNLATLTKPTMVANLVAEDGPTGFFTRVTASLALVFPPLGAAALSVNAAFIAVIANLCRPYGVQLISNDLQNFVSTLFVQQIPFNLTFLRSLGAKASEYFYRNSLISQYTPTLAQPNFINTQYFQITNRVVNSKVFTQLYSFTMSAVSDVNVSFLPSTFRSSIGSAIILYPAYDLRTIGRMYITLRDSNFNLLATFYDGTFTPTYPSILENQTFSVNYANTTTQPMIVFIWVYFDMVKLLVNEPYESGAGGLSRAINGIECFGNIEVRSNPILKTDLITPNTFSLISMSLSESATALRVYDASGALVRTIQTPSNGMLRYTSFGSPLWDVMIPNVTSRFMIESSQDKSFMACNLNAAITVNTIPPKTTPFVGSAPIALINYRNNGVALWVANISPKTKDPPSFQTVAGVTVDVATNVYVYGIHKGYNLFAYNADDTLYPNVIDVTSATDDSQNAFVIKYSNAGAVDGFMVLKTLNYRTTVSNVYIDPTTNAVLISASSSAPTTSVVGFNTGETFTVPYNGGFMVKIRNRSGTAVTYRYVSFVPNFSGQAYGLQGSTDAVGNMYTLFRCSCESATVYFSTVRTFAFVLDSPALSYVVVKSVESPGSQKYIQFVSPSFVNDGAQKMCTDPSGNIFAVVRASAQAYVREFQSLSYFMLFPAGQSDVNYLVKLNSDGIYQKNAVISNSSINRIVLIGTALYVDFKMTNVSTVFVQQAATLPPSFSIGANGSSGNGLVKFNTSDLSPSLVGYYIANT